MATERKARPMASFFKFTALGQRITGTVADYKPPTNDSTAFIVLEKVVIEERGKKPPAVFASAAVGLTTDLALKIGAGDVSQVLQMEFIEQERTKKGNPRKVFRVLQLTTQEYATLLRSANIERKDEPYHPEQKPEDTASDDDGMNETADDELPF